MQSRYGFDVIDGRRVPQLAISEDYVLTGFHSGTVHVESGNFTLEGTLQGTLDIQSGVTAHIAGMQQGTVSIDNGSMVTVTGTIQGTTSVSRGATLIIETGGRLAGTLDNNGEVILRGVFGGQRVGSGKLIIEEGGRIKQPTIRNGISYYEW